MYVYVYIYLYTTYPQALLQDAEPDDPQDAVVARQYKEQPDLYWKTARHWAQVYAGGEWVEHRGEAFVTMKNV